jgi:hypothetical protein
MFSVTDRERIRDWVLHLAESDPRIVAGAVVGSLANTPGDRWSDLDLTFAVAEGVSVVDVLDDWTRQLVTAFDAVHLFDLGRAASLYRVFLFPGNLQVDLSCTPAEEFGASGPKFRLLFGQAIDKPYPPPPSAHELFGYAVHHALRARFCIARGRYWQAEYWISGTRDYALSLACRRRGLPAVEGRGFDALPAEVRDSFRGTLVTALSEDELLRALSEAIDGLLREAEEVQEVAAKVEGQLRHLLETWDGEGQQAT